MATLLWDIAGLVDATPEGGSATWDTLVLNFINQDTGALLQSFTNGDSVIFGGTLAGAVTNGQVWIQESMTVGSIEIEAGNTYTFLDSPFDGLSGPALTVTGGLLANAGATLNYDTFLAGANNITANGTINFGASLTHTHTGQVNIQSGTTQISAGTTFSSNTFVLSGGTFDLDGSINELRYQGGVIDFAASASIDHLIMETGSFTQFRTTTINQVTMEAGGSFGVTAGFSIGSGGVSDTSANAITVNNAGTIGGNVDLGAGADTLNNTGTLNGDAFLGTGNDVSNGASVVFGQADRDTITGSSGADRLNGGTSDDTVIGAGGNDVLIGARGNDSLDGGDNDDRLYAGSGNDILIGGNGNDILIGGAGRDVQTGGAGVDRFGFQSMSDFDANRKPETITDFTQGEDFIFLTPIDANTNTVGDDEFVFIGANSFSSTAGELRYYQTAGATFIEMDVDGDGASDGLLRLDGVINLTAADFLPPSVE